MPEKRIVFHGSSTIVDEDLSALRHRSLRKIFLLSPANASGLRAQALLRPGAVSELARNLREAGAPLGHVYRYISSLYFRGKLTYAERFQNPPGGISGIYVITASAGLMSPTAMITVRDLENISAVPVDASNPQYRGPLDRDLSQLRASIATDTTIILLGSVASSKYVEPLLATFGDRLFFPKEFAGRGDMSRGGLLLRSAASGTELHYVPVGTSVRTGLRPAKLPRKPGSIR
jgi:hypothetical protein